MYIDGYIFSQVGFFILGVLISSFFHQMTVAGCFDIDFFRRISIQYEEFIEKRTDFSTNMVYLYK